MRDGATATTLRRPRAGAGARFGAHGRFGPGARFGPGGSRAASGATSPRRGVLRLTRATVALLCTLASARRADAQVPPPDTLAAARRAAARAARPDSLADLQSENGFVHFWDGQPSPPGVLEIVASASWAHLSDTPNPLLLSPGIFYTPRGGGGLRSMQLQLLPTVALGAGGSELSGVIFGWQQRWVADVARSLSMATLLQWSVTPGDGPPQTVLTGIVAKSFASTTCYLNSAVIFDGVERYQAWGTAVGVRRPVGGHAALTIDYIVLDERDEPAWQVLELAVEYHFTERVIVGPGLLIGLGNATVTPRYGIGVLVTIDL